jgi:hypothetical protein
MAERAAEELNRAGVRLLGIREQARRRADPNKKRNSLYRRRREVLLRRLTT